MVRASNLLFLFLKKMYVVNKNAITLTFLYPAMFPNAVHNHHYHHQQLHHHYLIITSAYAVKRRKGHLPSFFSNCKDSAMVTFLGYKNEL